MKESRQKELEGAILLMNYLNEFADLYGLEMPVWITKKYKHFQEILNDQPNEK